MNKLEALFELESAPAKDTVTKVGLGTLAFTINDTTEMINLAFLGHREEGPQGEPGVLLICLPYSFFVWGETDAIAEKTMFTKRFPAYFASLNELASPKDIFEKIKNDANQSEDMGSYWDIWEECMKERLTREVVSDGSNTVFKGHENKTNMDYILSENMTTQSTQYA